MAGGEAVGFVDQDLEVLLARVEQLAAASTSSILQSCPLHHLFEEWIDLVVVQDTKTYWLVRSLKTHWLMRS